VNGPTREKEIELRHYLHYVFLGEKDEQVVFNRKDRLKSKYGTTPVSFTDGRMPHD